MCEELSRNEKIYFINENINSMKKAHRIEVGKMIRCDEEIDDTRLINKGGGCQILFKYLPDALINSLYSYIKQKNDTESPK